MNKNDIIELYITDISADGSGIGHHEEMAVFVPLTAVGDTALVRIVKLKKSYAFGKVEELLTPSPNRITADCPVFKQCGGCVFRHISYESECAIKQRRVQETMRRIGKVDLPPQPIIAAVSENRYRNKAQFPVSPSGAVGFYAHHSHRVIECDDCALHPKEFKTACDIFTLWIRQNKIPVYNEQTKSGLVRHLYLRRGERSGEIMVCVVASGEKLPTVEPLIESLKNALGENLKSVILNVNKKDTNVVLGDKNILLYGREYIYDILCGVKIRISPFSFYQVNHDMAERLYEKAREYAASDGKNILDLYCGAGTIGLSMAQRAKKIIGVEIVPDAVRDARLNASENGFENTRFICADAAAAAQTLKAEGVVADTVILDPPRKGCDISLLQTVAEDFSPERIVYVSCDVATLARDTETLEKSGYKLKEYTPVDMFPRTSHVETVALFLRDINS